ncbi:hypothetical protein [Methyloversatilis sp.]|uniref:hypothetical protein n=1 Tax=Methyloversatilis sp. TaxID=2569862 RepID=UPI0035AF1EAE
MKNSDKIEFHEYCVRCTDKQVLGVLEKEARARRIGYRDIALREARKRDLAVSDVIRALIDGDIEYPDASALVGVEWGLDQDEVGNLYDMGM